MGNLEKESSVGNYQLHLANYGDDYKRGWTREDLVELKKAIETIIKEK